MVPPTHFPDSHFSPANDSGGEETSRQASPSTHKYSAAADIRRSFESCDRLPLFRSRRLTQTRHSRKAAHSQKRFEFRLVWLECRCKTPRLAGSLSAFKSRSSCSPSLNGLEAVDRYGEPLCSDLPSSIGETPGQQVGGQKLYFSAN